MLIRAGAILPAVRNLGFKIFLAAGLLTVLFVCGVIWGQHIKQRERIIQAEQIAAQLASAVTSYIEGNDGQLPHDLESLEAWTGNALPLNPITGDRLHLVDVLHNDQNFDVTILGALPARANTEKGEEAKVVSPVIIVYGQPFYKGLDIEADSLPDPVMAHWPPGPVDQEWSYTDHLDWKCESLAQVVRREEDRLRAMGDRGQLEKGDKPRY